MAEPDLERTSKIERKIRANQVALVALLGMSILFPILAWHEVWQQDEKGGAWFQRSGCLTVLFAAFAEYRIFVIRDLLEPIDEKGKTWQDMADENSLKTKYRKRVKAYDFISIALLTIGTLIWGFGDLI